MLVEVRSSSNKNLETVETETTKATAERTLTDVSAETPYNKSRLTESNAAGRLITQEFCLH